MRTTPILSPATPSPAVSPLTGPRTRRALRVALCGLAVAAVALAVPARAADDDDDDEPSFEQKLIGKLMSGIQGKTFDNNGIDYRERSPLVVPPKLDLPPPDRAAAVPPAPNWPKDPEIKKKKVDAENRRKARIANRDNVADPRVLKPNELDGDPAMRRPTSGYDAAASWNPTLMSPSQLGYKGGIFGSFFGKSDGSESAPFTAEPPRTTLSAPPPGYQTPSPNYAYGTGAPVNGGAPEPRPQDAGPLKPNKL